MQARVLSHHGRHAWVIDAQGGKHHCLLKGRDLLPTANDDVLIDDSAVPAVITEILDRRNLLRRSEAHRTKLLAANLDQVVILVSGSPLFSDEILARILCACAGEGLTGAVVLNKTDLANESQEAHRQLAPFREALSLLGWPVFETVLRKDVLQGLETLRAFLEGKTSLVIGQSGMGKSSLLNALVPELNLQTREISSALQTGRHTTTASQMFSIARDSWVVDSPGFQLYGLDHLSLGELSLGFPEWEVVFARLGRCRFANCRHQNEPGCRLEDALKEGQIAPRRLGLWHRLINDVE